MNPATREQWRAVRVLAIHEMRATLRARMVPAFAVVLAILALAIAVAGLAASGQLLVQGFERTSVSLLSLGVYLMPLLGLVMGAAAFGDEDGGTELLLSQPISRGQVLFGRSVGLAASLVLVSVTGFGCAGVVVLVAAGSHGFLDYLFVSGGSTLIGLAGLFAGIFIGVVARRRSVSVGWALAAWFGAAVLYDLGAILILQLSGSGRPGPLLVTLLALNPIDGVRIIALQFLGADVHLGPTGAALERAFGDRGALWILGSLALWMALSLGGARSIYRRRDF